MNYIEQAMRTSAIQSNNPHDTRYVVLSSPTLLLLNSSLGLCGESGEFSEHIKKHVFQGHELDNEKMVEELGDIFWYLAVACHTLGVTFEEVQERNVEKLKKRYPDKFEVSRSVSRENE